MAVDAHSADHLAQVMSYQPGGSLAGLAGRSAADQKALLTSDAGVFKALVDGVSGSDERSVSWCLATLCDLLRTDSSSFSLFEGSAAASFKSTTSNAVRSAKSVFVADKAAWLFSAVAGNVPKAFSESDVQSFLSTIQGASSTCSEQGKLDAAVNVLKASGFRRLVTNTGLVSLSFDAAQTPPNITYKQLFALWLLSFEGPLNTTPAAVVERLKDAFVNSRVEKVVRLALTCLQSLIASNQEVADEVVEQGLLEVVQALEYEKWRDTDLYEEIRTMSAQIATRTAEMSNFARYERELGAGKLKWGFIHSPKFWSENVLKFEQHDWRALKALSTCLDVQSDSTTVAVACRDLGEFVTSHPLGKKQIAALGVKDKVMKLMSNTSEQNKEVRREALLCCQKIMLNKWQDVETA